ncbi:MAG: hypothetical protein ABII71_02815 [Candidatus Micrarchaeota archaeon]
MKNFIISGLLSGLAIAIVWILSNIVIGLIFPYSIMDLGGMRPMEDPLMAVSFLYPWVLGFAMSYIFPFVRPEGKDALQKGLCFGGLMWLVALLPSAFLVYTSMVYPIGFTVEQMLGGAAYMLAGGVTIAMLRSKK